MHYEFPVISHLDDVMGAFDENHFMLVQKEGYQVINYLMSGAETFPDVVDKNTSIRREFRGLIFDKNGWLIRRPLHKFYNVNERASTMMDTLDFTQPHIILAKEDGSMIVPFIVEDKVLWGTKMGFTEVSEPVHKFIEQKPHYEEFARSMISRLNASPIFEWCSRQQQIVLDYPREKLVLTAMRAINTGEYYSISQMEHFAQPYGIPVVGAFAGEMTKEFHDKVRTMEGIEGFVIRFDNGHMCKIKCDWYCQIHQVKSDICRERGVAALILNQKVDDLKPMLLKEDLVKLEAYEKAFNDNLSIATMTVMGFFIQNMSLNLSRKEFALNVAKTLEPWMTSTIYKTWDSPTWSTAITEHLQKMILNNCGKEKNFQELRQTSLLNQLPQWRPQTTEIDDE